MTPIQRKSNEQYANELIPNITLINLNKLMWFYNRKNF